MKLLKKLLRRIYENNLDRKKIILQLRRYHEKKYINKELLYMLLGVFKVQETRVKDIMIPRTNMVIIKKNSSINEILPLIINSSHSRFPVILENKDEIVGILLAKDLLKYIDKESDSFNIEEIIRPSVIIPETKKLNVLLSEFKSGRNHLAVVVDEYGGVSGLITIEDVLEQIVGDIIDEHDNVKQNINIKKIKNLVYTVAGSTTLDEFNAFFKSNYSSENYDTISGLLINRFKRLPGTHDAISFDNFKFQIKISDQRRIHSIQVEIKG
jgi:magnesium and cobalt transporter